MSFDNNKGYKILKDAFARFSAKHNPSQLNSKLGNVAKGALDAFEKEFPRSAVEEFVNDVHGLLSGQDLSDGISQMIRGMDYSQMEEAMNKMVDQLKEPQINQALAVSIKQLSSTQDFSEFKMQIDFLVIKKLPPQIQVFAEMGLQNFETFFENARDMSTQDIAKSISDFADSIPTAVLAQQAYAVVAYMSPEMLTGVLKQATQNLPDAKTVGDKYDMGLKLGRMMIDQQFNKASGPKKPANDDAKNKPQPKKPRKGKGDDISF